MEQIKKIEMLATSFKDEYDYALDMQVGLASAAHSAKKLTVSSAEMLKSLAELEEALPRIIDLRKQIAEKQKQVDALLREAGWYEGLKEEKEEREEEEEDPYF